MPIYRILRKWKVQCTSYESDGYIITEMMMKWTHVYDFLYISVVSRPSLVRGVVGPYNHIEGLVPWFPSTGGSRARITISRGWYLGCLVRGVVGLYNHIEGFVPLSPLQGGGRPWKCYHDGHSSHMYYAPLNMTFFSIIIHIISLICYLSAMIMHFAYNVLFSMFLHGFHT